MTRLLLTVFLFAGCSGLGQPSSADIAGRRVEAAALIARWTAALPSAGESPAFVPIGELTGQVGDWEPAVGDNNKIALMAGSIVATVPLAAQAATRADVRWDDGTTWSAPTISAAQALAAIQGRSDAPVCPGCVSLRVTGAMFSTVRIETSRGMATAPAWEFAIAGTAVRVTRIAISPEAIVTVDPGSFGSDAGWVGPPVQSATGRAAANVLTVSFVGAPDPGDKPCGSDYSAEAVESAIVVVVIVIEHRNVTLGACSAVGAPRTASVALSAPLGARVVLDVDQGLPVPVELLH